MIKKLIFIIFFFVLIILSFNPPTLEARSGCCSHHGGVCGCSCCDGTPLSSTCAPYYPSCNSGSINSDEIENWLVEIKNIRVTYTPDSFGTFTIYVDWDRPNGKSYSVGLSKGGPIDPGPLADTTQSEFTFSKVSSGVWYVNIKERLSSGNWSKGVYTTVTLPKWTNPIPSPSPLLIPKNNYDTNSNVSGSEDSIIPLLAIGGISLAGIYLASKPK